MEKHIELITSVVPTFEKDHIATPFPEAGIDSIDLVTIRVDLEKHLGRPIPDSEWLTFKSLSDVVSFCEEFKDSNGSSDDSQEKVDIKKDLVVGMPQMAVEAMSENWLFKEIGDTHWEMLCDGLQKKSHDLKDELDNRLYATFVRIKLESSVSLYDFKENDDLSLKGRIRRYGSGMYFSNIGICSGKKTINASLMTSFSIRNKVDNKKLLKSQPATDNNLIEEYDDMPDFSNEYRLIKKGEVEQLALGDTTFDLHEESIFETEYNLNLYYDLNGVGLLYFAAYPIISDVCLARYYNEKFSEEEPWELSYYTMSRDILYYANCNINDKIIYKLHSFTFLDDKRVKISSSLYRKSDGKIMARLFTIKHKKK